MSKDGVECEFRTKQVQSLKHIDHQTTYLVHGYIRNEQKSLPRDNFHIIPDLVIITCLLYYSFTDTWDIDNLGELTKLLDQNTIQVTSNTAQSIFLSQIVTVSNDNNYNWKFRLNKYDNYWWYNMCIGLWNIDYKPDYTDAISDM